MVLVSVCVFFIRLVFIVGVRCVLGCGMLISSGMWLCLKFRILFMVYFFGVVNDVFW